MKKHTSILSSCTQFLLVLSLGVSSSSVLAQDIPVGALANKPVVDGSAADWSQTEGTRISLKNNKSGGKTNVSGIDVKAGVHGDRVYFLLQWDDDDMDDQHKPYVWDSASNKYVAGDQREDRLAIQFAISGDYDVNWLSGKLFSADTWHWKAARSNPLGIAHDKSTIISSEKAKKSYTGKADDGSTVYIQRPSDEGDKLYKTKRYPSKEKDMMPKYILASTVSGSVADVEARGVWENGRWTLEMSRKMNTGNPDDAAFMVSQSIKGGIAVFDRSGDDDHGISEILNFQF